MRETFFLWPQAEKLQWSDVFGATYRAAHVEEKLQNIYSGTEPVLFSSARAGLNALLLQMGLSRPDLIWVPGFSSHCLIDAIGHQSTPTPILSDKLAAAVVYHQWGHVHQANFSQNVIVIEDAVDSLFIPGKSPFAISSEFVLWSLPKVIGTIAGGVVFCKSRDVAQELRQIRDDRPRSHLQAALRLGTNSSAIASRYWNGAEAMQGNLVSFLYRQIYRQLDKLDAIVESRMQLLRLFGEDLAQVYFSTGRLPSNIPLAVPKQWEKIWGKDGSMTAGLRSFNVLRNSPRSEWMKVAPLPVHINVSSKNILEVFHLLDQKGPPYELKIV